MCACTQRLTGNTLVYSSDKSSTLTLSRYLTDNELTFMYCCQLSTLQKKITTHQESKKPLSSRLIDSSVIWPISGSSRSNLSVLFDSKSFFSRLPSLNSLLHFPLASPKLAETCRSCNELSYHLYIEWHTTKMERENILHGTYIRVGACSFLHSSLNIDPMSWSTFRISHRSVYSKTGSML